MSFFGAEDFGEVDGDWHSTKKRRQGLKKPKKVYTTQFCESEALAALETMDEAPAESAPISVPHDVAPAPIRYLSLPEVSRANFAALHNVTINPDDDVDLDHTSCDSEDDEHAAAAAPSGPSAFGSKRRMNECFLCRWGNEEADSEHMRTIRKMILENIGKIDTKFIALTVHRYYMEIVRPEAQLMGRCLPAWRSKDIFVCIETHNFYPEIRLTRNLSDLAVIENGILRQLFTEHGPDAKNIKLYTEIVKLGWTLRNTKIDALNFNSGGVAKLGASAQQPRAMRIAHGVKRPHTSLLQRNKD
jgi:hypothetical protein